MVGPLFIILQAARYGIGIHMLRKVLPHLSKGQLSKDTFVQGTVVQGHFSPRDISPRRHLSKETLVQGDFCPRYKFETLIAVHIFFSRSIINLIS